MTTTTVPTPMDRYLEDFRGRARSALEAAGPELRRLIAEAIEVACYAQRLAGVNDGLVADVQRLRRTALADIRIAAIRR